MTGKRRKRIEARAEEAVLFFSGLVVVAISVGLVRFGFSPWATSPLVVPFAALLLLARRF